ncbi:MAG: MBL fold metallo-hydrolase [bacterium]
MHLQVLSSGSKGNATLVRAGDLQLLVDAGLGVRALSERFAAAHVGPRNLDHLLVTHGHRDHSRSAGAVAKRQHAVLHAAEAILTHRGLARAPDKHALRIGRAHTLLPERGEGEVTYTPVLLPHDCDPTVAFKLEHEGRCAVILTDIGQPCPEVARHLKGAQLLVLEFNYDAQMLREGPYPETLKRRISGGRGHLSNVQAAKLLGQLAGPDLHTLVLAHLSAHNNTPGLALAAAQEALAGLGLERVRVIVASQDQVGENLAV